MCGPAVSWYGTPTGAAATCALWMPAARSPKYWLSSRPSCGTSCDRMRPDRNPAARPVVVELVGPAGAGKSALAEQLDDHRRSEEHTSELQSPCNLVCRLLLEKKKMITTWITIEA